MITTLLFSWQQLPRRQAATPTLLSPPDIAKMSPVIDQLACHTTSLKVLRTYRERGVGWSVGFCWLGGEKCSFRSKSRSPKGRGEVKENLYLGGKLCDLNYFTIATKWLVNLLDKTYLWVPFSTCVLIFAPNDHFAVLEGRKQNRFNHETDSTTKQREV